MSKFEKYDKSQLIKFIEKLEKNLVKANKYGLVWDNEFAEEDVASKVQEFIPILESTKRDFNFDKNSNNTNILIEGDNLYSLTILNMLYKNKNKIKLIYIDPPYNTGNKDFKYNDVFVDKEDGYRHSKWLSFMEKRLKIAREILSDDGLILISIDDNEQANLKLLMDKVFGESNFITSFIWQKKKGGGQAKYIYEGHEYLLCYAKQKNKISKLTIENEDYNKSKNKIINGIEYYVNDDIIRVKHGKYNKGTERRCHYEDLREFKGDYKLKEVNEKIAKGEYILVPSATDEKKHYVARLELAEGKRKVVYSIISHVRTEHGNEDIEKIFNKNVFENAKPVDYIKYLLKFIDDPNATILDFFAGSGTTGQAVLELNKEDGGSRKFILCTNNENNICKEITYQRLLTIVSGKRFDGSKYSDGINANLKYFEISFIKNLANTDQLKYNFTEKADNLINLEEETHSLLIKNESFSVYTNNKDDKRTFIYYDFYEKKTFESFLKEINNYKSKKAIYLFSTDDLVNFPTIVSEIKNTEIKPYPAKILDVYKLMKDTLKRG